MKKVKATRDGGISVPLTAGEITQRENDAAANVLARANPPVDPNAEIEAAVKAVPAAGDATPDERIDALIAALIPANGAKVRGRRV